MDKAKAAVSNFLSKDGKHDTTVHESVNPAVVNERVTRTNHEEATKAVDREIHQDHYHTSVQPITHQEILPEKHSHNLVGVENREIHHGDGSHIKQRLEEEAARFKNTREIGETKNTQSTSPTIAGEHIHHHVHETIQPVVQKETIQPSVVHTTIPVHEVHHNEAKHHTASALPAMTMSEFQSSGGALGGRKERTDAFAGEPRSVGGALGNERAQGGVLGGRGAEGTTTLTENEGRNGLTGNNTTGGDYDNTTTGRSGLPGNNTTGRDYDNPTTANSRLSGNKTTGDDYNNTTGTTGKKASLMDKLNPKVDSNGDGKAGFMK